MSISSNQTPLPETLQLSAIDHLDAHSHSVQFYTDDSFLVDSISRHVGAALVAGDSAVVVATEAHRAALFQRLRRRGLDLNLAAQQGRYVALDAAETLASFMVKGVPHARRFAEVVGGIIDRANAAAETEQPRAAVFGEMVALLWAQGNADAAIILEQLWNELAESHSFYLRCAYPMAGFFRAEHGDAFRSICAAHTEVIPDESYTALSTTDERLRIISELQQKAQALESEIAARKEIQRSLQRRESDLSDFLENAVEGVQQVGADQRIRWANRSLLQLLGYAEHEYVGHELAEFHADRATFDEFWRRLMERRDICDFPADLRARDGSLRHVRIHSNGLWENGRFVHTRCFIRDVTEQTRMEEALRRSEKLAATARLAASIAHEINNPLEALTNLLYLLHANPSLDQDARVYARLADGELRRIAHITRQMLTFYRETSCPVAFSAGEVMDSVLGLFESKLRARKVVVHKTYAAQAQIEGFPSEIRQLLANLLDNAIDAAGAGGNIRVRVCQSRDWRQPARRGVRITIADSGSGVAHENYGKLFEPFFTTKGEAGTGLGLWVCRTMVQKHDGILRFRSSTRGGRSGTVFSVFLPCAAERSAAPVEIERKSA